MLVRLMPLLVRLAERAVRRAQSERGLRFSARHGGGAAALATTFLAVAVGAATFARLSLDARAAGA